MRYVAAQLRQKIPTALLNRAINDAVERRQPVTAAGHHLKFFYATQVRQAPPTFLLFVNRDELFSDGYKKYLAGEIRAAFGYEGCPVVLVPKARPKTVEPKRRPKQPPRRPEPNQRRGHRTNENIHWWRNFKERRPCSKSAMTLCGYRGAEKVTWCTRYKRAMIF